MIGPERLDPEAGLVGPADYALRVYPLKDFLTKLGQSRTNLEAVEIIQVQDDSNWATMVSAETGKIIRFQSI